MHTIVTQTSLLPFHSFRGRERPQYLLVLLGKDKSSFLCQQFAQCFVIFNLFYFDLSRSLSLPVCLSPFFCGLAICRSISQSNKQSLSCHVKVKNVAEAVLHYVGAPSWNHSIFMPTAEDRGCTSDQPCKVVNCPFK